MIRGSDNTLSAAQLLVVPENDRFRLPAATDVSTIRWHNWHGRFTSRPEGPTRLGVLRPDPRRAPLNDNFVAWRIGEQSSDGFTVSAPVESRYLDGERIGTVTSKLKYLLATRLGWQIARIESASSIPIGQPINLPGTAPAVSYPEGPLYGDDVLSRLKSADRLSRRIVESLK
jgi:hypothetical protein